MIATLSTERIHYPDSDGKPMADNTLQFDWISILKWNADAYFAHRDDVFVAGDNLIYPVEGKPKVPSTRCVHPVRAAKGLSGQL